MSRSSFAWVMLSFGVLGSATRDRRLFLRIQNLSTLRLRSKEGRFSKVKK
jgi:hypothetical protein